MSIFQVQLTLSQTVALAFALAWIVEAFVEYVFGYVLDQWEGTKKYKVWLPYISLAAGIGLCFYYNASLIALIIGETEPVGVALTGFLISRGAGFLNDFLSFLGGKMKKDA